MDEHDTPIDSLPPDRAAAMREQASRLDEVLAKLAASTRPDTVERATLVAYLEKLLDD